jgi:hypothetical protein
MKSILPPVATLAVLLFGAAGSQVYGPGPGSKLCSAGKPACRD